MKILFFGDIYGRVWRKAFIKEFQGLKEKYNPDFVVVNIDNITSWRGAVEHHARMISDLWVDVLTGGDHVFDNFDSIELYISADNSNLLRPGNFHETVTEKIPGIGHKVFHKNEKKLLVIHVLGQVFIHHKVQNPFHYVDEVLAQYDTDELDGIMIDFHREATSEIQGMAFYLDGRVSFVWGTHTHVQTNDDRILSGGTGTITDVGMNGPLNSVIGADFGSVKKRFLTWLQRGKICQSLDKEYVISGISIDIDEQTQKCKWLEKIRIYSKLDS